MVTRRQFLAAGLALGCSIPLTSLAAQRVVVGYVGPLSGPDAMASVEYLAGVKAALAKINASGGVAGADIALEIRDDKSDPKTTAKLARELIDASNVIALLAPHNLSSIEAIIQVAKERGIPVFGGQSGASILFDASNPNTFNIRPSHQIESESAVELLGTIGIKRLALLRSDDPVGEDFRVGTEIGCSLNNTSFDTVSISAAQLKDKSVSTLPKLDFSSGAVMLGMDSIVVPNYVAAIRRKGYSLPIVVFSNCNTKAFLESLGEFKEGVIMIQVVPSPYSVKLQVAREFRTAASSSKDITTSHSGLHGFVAGKLLANALERSGKTLNAANLSKALGDTAARIDIGGFLHKFDRKTKTTSSFVEISMLRKDGRIVQ